MTRSEPSLLQKRRQDLCLNLSLKLDRILANPFIPWVPTAKQLQFLADDRLEGLYGGAAGGGKSIALLMAAAEYVDQPQYSAILFRRTLTMLEEPSALIPISHEWFAGKAQWSEQKKRWTFPSGATLTFRYLDGPRDHLNYQGAAYHFIGFDEATQFNFAHYKYLFSRARRSSDDTIPLRVRGATNPGGNAHADFKQRFMVDSSPDRFFVSATLEDNQHLDRDEYERSLKELDAIHYEQLRRGSWADPESKVFKRDWLHFCDMAQLPKPDYRIVVGDTAQKTGANNDYSCFFEWGFNKALQKAWPISCLRGKFEYGDLVNAFKSYYASIKQGAPIRGVHIEDKSSGISLNQDLKRASGMPIIPIKRGRDSKEDRAANVIGHFISGNVLIPTDAPFAKDLVDELLIFPSGKNDDQVDVTVDAVDIFFNKDEKPKRRMPRSVKFIGG